MTRTVFIRGYGSERDFQATVEAALLRLGFLVYSVPDSRRATARGYPDVTFAGHGMVGFIECKAKGGKVRPEQERWVTQLGRAGVFAAIVYPDGWDELCRELAYKVQRP